MQRIIVSLSTNGVIKYLKRQKAPSAAIVFLDKKLRQQDILRNLKNLKEIRIEQMSEEERIICERQYVENIAVLSRNYNSLEWWANPVSEKNEHLSQQYKNLCLLYKSIKAIDEFESNEDIYFCGNKEVLDVVYSYCSGHNINVIRLDNLFLLWLLKVKESLIEFLKIFLLINKFLKRKISLFRLKARIKEKLIEGANFYIIRTWLDDRFLSRSNVYHDAYFGSLPEYVAKKNNRVLFLVGCMGNYASIIRKIKEFREDVLFVPEEYFLRFKAFFFLFRFLIGRKTKSIKSIYFNNIDVTRFYQEEIARNYHSERYINNIFSYLIARRLAQEVEFKTYIQTFENYAWEKLTILGIKEYKKNCKIIGFQHAFISRNSFKYFPGKMEGDITPLPDKIITMGKKTRDIMQRYGDYNKEILVTGCSLRQENITKTQPFKRGRFNRVLVPLTMVKEESVETLRFLSESGVSDLKGFVVIRCHPALPLDKFRSNIGFEIPDNFIFSNDRPVERELQETDIVIYTWSTVAVEALRLGVPVVYLDIFRPMYVDPLFECNALKITVSKKEELLSVVQSLYSMTEETFYREQQVAQEYLKEYFYPVNSDTLGSFLN